MDNSLKQPILTLVTIRTVLDADSLGILFDPTRDSSDRLHVGRINIQQKYTLYFLSLYYIIW